MGQWDGFYSEVRIRHIASDHREPHSKFVVGIIQVIAVSSTSARRRGSPRHGSIYRPRED